MAYPLSLLQTWQNAQNFTLGHIQNNKGGDLSPEVVTQLQKHMVLKHLVCMIYAQKNMLTVETKAPHLCLEPLVLKHLKQFWRYDFHRHNPPGLQLSPYIYHTANGSSETFHRSKLTRISGHS